MSVTTPSAPRNLLSPGEALVVTCVCFGLFMLSSVSSMLAWSAPAPEAASAGGEGFSDAVLLGILVWELVFAALALAFLRWRRYDIAGLLPRPTLRDSGIGVLILFVTYLLTWVVVMPFAAGQDTQPIERMVSEARPAMHVLVAFAMVNGSFEEVFLLGCLMRGLRGFGLSIALGIPLLVRVLYHVYQGPLGALSILVFGLVMGIVYLRTGRLWPVVFAHVLGDIVPFTMH